MKEEKVFFGEDQIRLEGLFASTGGIRGAVILHPHSLMGGDMWNAVVETIARALFAAGISTLRFNFRGGRRQLGMLRRGAGGARGSLGGPCLSGGARAKRDHAGGIFLIDLFGMRVAFEDGIKCALSFGANPEDSIYIVQRDDGPVIDHIAISITDFDLQETEKAIQRLGLDYMDDGDSAWTLTDLNGYRVQVCAETGVYPGAARDFFHQTRTKK